ncbi:uncharacterized protein [Parasteatoda tepidariorum]|uniref:uncharacterized protein n=1 Tax=Parasteatoda tepidariorum TaxID=114398 RepID=UPI0039BCE3C5
MKDLGEANYCSGIKIDHNRSEGSINQNQTQYVERMLKKYNMHESHPVPTPLDPNQVFTKIQLKNDEYNKASDSGKEAQSDNEGGSNKAQSDDERSNKEQSDEEAKVSGSDREDVCHEMTMKLMMEEKKTVKDENVRKIENPSKGAELFLKQLFHQVRSLTVEKKSLKEKGKQVLAILVKVMKTVGLKRGKLLLIVEVKILSG